MSLGHIPIVAVTVQQGLAVEAKIGNVVRVATVGLFIQCHEERSALNGIQSDLVLAGAEEGLTCLCPLYPGDRYKVRKAVEPTSVVFFFFKSGYLLGSV